MPASLRTAQGSRAHTLPVTLLFVLRLLGQYFLPQRGRIALLSALILGDIALRLLNPQIIRTFIDTAEAGGPERTLTIAALLFLAAGLLGRLLNLSSVYTGLRLSWTATNALRSDLAAHLLRLDMPFHKAHTPGELIERVDGDVTTLAEFFADVVIKLAGNALLVGGILALLYRENTAAGLGLTVYTGIVLAASALIGFLGIPAWTAAREAWAEQMSYLEERFTATEDLRGIGAEGHALDGLGRRMLSLLYRARAGWLANALGHVISNSLFITGYALGLALGAFLYLRGDVTIGAAFVLVYYIGMLSGPIDALHDVVEQFQRAAAGSQRVGELLGLSPVVADTGAASLPGGALSVTFERVSFRYQDREQEDGEGEQLVLSDVSFSLAPGRVLGVLGRTGSGKTTLTRLLLRLYDPQAGAVRLAGTDIRDVPLSALREAVGLVTQDVQIFAATVRENITLFAEGVDDAAVKRACAELGITGWITAMPQQYDTPLSSGGGGMSGGEAQLLAFVRILLRNPGLVVLDEAASHLDPVTERRIEQAIDRLLSSGANRRTAIIIAHRLQTVQRADDILVLEDGRVAEFGSRDALAADPHSRFSRLLRTGLEEVLA